MNAKEILKSKRDEIIHISQLHGVSNLRLFGSIARGEAGRESDIDLLVELSPAASLLDLIALKNKIEDLTGCKVDLVTEAAVSPYIRDQILRESVAI